MKMKWWIVIRVLICIGWFFLAGYSLFAESDSANWQIAFVISSQLAGFSNLRLLEIEMAKQVIE